MGNVTFSIRESKEGDQIIFEVWRRNHEFGTECLLAEADNRSDARELLRHYAAEESDRQRAAGQRLTDQEVKWIAEGMRQQANL